MPADSYKDSDNLSLNLIILYHIRGITEIVRQGYTKEKMEDYILSVELLADLLCPLFDDDMIKIENNLADELKDCDNPHVMFTNRRALFRHLMKFYERNRMLFEEQGYIDG